PSIGTPYDCHDVSIGCSASKQYHYDSNKSATINKNNMKLSVRIRKVLAIPVLIGALGNAAAAQQTALALPRTAFEGKTVYFKDFFIELEQRFNVRINYDAERIGLATLEAPAIGNLSKRQIAALLNQLLLPHGMEAENVSGQFYVVKPKGAAGVAANAVRVTNRAVPVATGQHSVSGIITDAADGTPLSGVTIRVRGGSVGGSSSNDGRFTLSGIANDDVLVFSSVGYRTQEVPVDGRSNLVVQLGRLEDVLEEVVVTALGIRREEKALGYAVQRLDGDAVQKVKGVDVATALTGKVAGLWIQNSTEFDQSPDIRLRGGGSNPLLVVDGVPYGNLGLREIAPDDIESIDVLKGATASALYGVRGGGGAIIVTTKSGGNGISVNSNNMFFAGYLALPEVQTSYSAGLGGSYNSIDYVWGNKLDAGIMEEQWNPETKQMEVMEL